MLDEKKVRELRDHIHKHPESFEMSTWIKGCGTVGCIAGLAVITQEPEEMRRLAHEPGRVGAIVPMMGARLLGLQPGSRLVNHLFTPPSWALDLLWNQDLLEEDWQIGSNIGPSREAVDRMEDWVRERIVGPGEVGSSESLINATQRIYKMIDAPVAVRALDGLVAHPVYVDWREAIEEVA